MMHSVVTDDFNCQSGSRFYDFFIQWANDLNLQIKQALDVSKNGITNMTLKFQIAIALHEKHMNLYLADSSKYSNGLGMWRVAHRKSSGQWAQQCAQAASAGNQQDISECILQCIESLLCEITEQDTSERDV
jgi:hypothetical protein